MVSSLIAANLTFDPAYEMLDFPLYLGKNWTTTTNITGEEDLTVSDGIIPCLVVEINGSFEVMGEPTSHLRTYWISQMDDGIFFPKQQRYLNKIRMEELELIEIYFTPPQIELFQSSETAVRVKSQVPVCGWYQSGSGSR